VAGETANEVIFKKDNVIFSAASAMIAEVRPIITTEDVVNELLRRGIPLDQILIPEPDKQDGFWMADDFNDPFPEFEEL
jgi:hypothetical protein